MRYEIRTIGVWAFIRVAFFFNLVAGLLGGFFAAVALSLMVAVMTPFASLERNVTLESVPAAVLFILLPLFCSLVSGVVGTLLGALIVAVYNGLARLTGGLELELEPAERADQSVAAVRPAERPFSAGVVPPPPPVRTPPPPPPMAPLPAADGDTRPIPQEPWGETTPDWFAPTEREGDDDRRADDQ